ncbi:MAG: hypothetical protein Q8P51_03180 [Ignavibacteria bacterium]|nr:hypothetical protein [Ignavibacteria bacterium]
MPAHYLAERYGNTPTARILALIALVSVLLLAVALSFRQIDSPDIGLHLAPGKWILSHLAFPTHEIFTYGAANNSYVDLYWLYQVTMALLEKLGGAFLLVLANALLVVGSLFVVFHRSVSHPKAPRALAILLLLFVAFTANYEMRPHAASWLYMGLLLMVWEGYYDDPRRSLIPVPLIMLLWVNTQPTFILGWLVTFSFWFSVTLREKHIEKKATVFGVLGIVVCLLNPYFLKGMSLPFVQFGFLQQPSVFKGLIAEYSPLPFLPGPEDYTYFGSLVILRPMFMLQLLRIVLTLVFVIQIARRKMRNHEILLFLLFFYLNSIAEKNIGYYILVVAPFVVRSFGQGEASSDRFRQQKEGAKSLSSLVSRLKQALASERFGNLVVFCVLLASILMTMRVVSNDFYSTQRLSHRFGYVYNNLFLPVKAAEFLNERHLTGEIFNHIDFGGYLIDHVPQKSYIDARNEVMGEDLAREYLETNSANGLRQLVQKYQPDVILFPHKDGLSWLEFLQSDPAGWRLVYFDELAAMYLRNGYAGEVLAVHHDSMMASLGGLLPAELDSVLRRSFQKSVFDPFIRGQYFPVRESELSAFCSDNGWDRLAIRYAVEGIRRTTVPCPEIFYNLSIYFQKVGDRDRAELCLRRASE